MNFTRRGLIASAAATALLIAGSIGTAYSADPEVERVTYGGSGWLAHYPVWIGIKKGFFANRGLTVEWENFTTTSSRMSALAIGQIEFGGVGSIATIAAMAAGAQDFYVVGTPDSYATVEGLIASDAVADIAGLRGKKIGVPFATSSHVLILDLLSQAGLDPERDVSLINLPSADTPSALAAGQVDAVMVWTPAFNQLRAQPGTHVLADAREFSLYKQFKVAPGPDLLIVNRTFANDNPNATAAFLDGFYESSKFIGENPDEAASILVELTQLSTDEQLEVLQDIVWIDGAEQPLIMAEDGAFTQGVQSLAEFLVKYNQIDNAPNVYDWVKVPQ